MGTKRNLISLEDWSDSIEKVCKKLKTMVAGSAKPRITPEEYMKHYTDIYNLYALPDSPYQDKIYAKYRQLCEEYVASDIMAAIQEKKDDDYLILRELVKQWENFKVMGQLLSRLFYPVRGYVARNFLATPQEVVTIFRNLAYKEVNGRAREAVICLIDKERDGEQIDQALLKKVSDLFVEMGPGDLENLCYYQKDFEQQVIDATGLYYSREASSWIVEDSCPGYLMKAEGCFRKERERASRCLHSRSVEKLIARVQHELLAVHQRQLLDNEQSGCVALLREENFENLSRMFMLFRELPGGLEPMANIFKKHIADQGKDFVQQVDQSAKEKHNCIRKIIELHDKCMAYVSGSFSDNKVFHQALREAFEVFCNKVIAGGPSVEVLATFCENLIKKSDNDETVEETLEKVVKLLEYFNDKDLFIEFHRKKLGRRLLFDKSGKKDNDISFLTKLKSQFGACITSKMEGMLTDVMMAKENQRKLEDWFGSNLNRKPKFDLSVTVLTTGFWPSYKSSDLKLPREMVKGVKAFKKFYKTKTKNRKLTWSYSLGNCHINGRFEQITVELIVSTYQATALMLFNDVDSLSFSEIKNQLNLSHGEVVRVLHSLSCAKYKILNKEPKTKTISETDSFEFNAKFTDRMRRIRIPQPPIDDERKKISEDVNQDRRHHIDAALVRVMKSRKVLGNQQLISECVGLLSKTFKPEIEAIKKQIEVLIDREYLQRDNNKPNVFIYLP